MSQNWSEILSNELKSFHTILEPHKRSSSHKVESKEVKFILFGDTAVYVENPKESIKESCPI